MSLPYTREVTAISGVTTVSADVVNAIQDSIIEINSRIISDHFTGSAVDTGIWSPSAGSPTTVNDDAAGGYGALLLDGAENVDTLALALGTVNWRWRARVRASVSPSGTTSFYMGIIGPANLGVRFAIDGPSSTTNWRVYVNSGTSSAANGTAATISNSYKDFEIRRIGTTVTFLVDGVVMHTASSYSSNLNATSVILYLVTPGSAAIRVDSVTFGPI